MTFNIAKIGKIWEKEGKIWKIWSMTKKSHQKFLPRKWKFFPKNRHSEILGPPKIFSVPQTRRQVSAANYGCGS